MEIIIIPLTNGKKNSRQSTLWAQGIVIYVYCIYLYIYKAIVTKKKKKYDEQNKYNGRRWCCWQYGTIIAVRL